MFPRLLESIIYFLTNGASIYSKDTSKASLHNALRPFCIEKNYSRKYCIILSYEIKNAALSSNAFILPK